MSEVIYAIKARGSEVDGARFVELLHDSNMISDFEFNQIPDVVRYFSEEISDFVARYGFSAIYNHSVLMEDITSPSQSVNDIEKVIGKFVSRLDGAKRLMVIDPYFYADSASIDVAEVFKNLLNHASSALEEIIFVTSGQKNAAKGDIHAAVLAVVPNCKIHDFQTSEFHDRFWVDPDATKGLVMGTSLNGLGRKIALVDKLADADVAEIVGLAKAAGVSV